MNICHSRTLKDHCTAGGFKSFFQYFSYLFSGTQQSQIIFLTHGKYIFTHILLWNYYSLSFCIRKRSQKRQVTCIFPHFPAWNFSSYNFIKKCVLIFHASKSPDLFLSFTTLFCKGFFQLE